MELLWFTLILQKGDLLFKSFNNYRYLEMEVLAQEETFIENSSINIEFLNRAGQITAGGGSCIC